MEAGRLRKSAPVGGAILPEEGCDSVTLRLHVDRALYADERHNPLISPEGLLGATVVAPL